MSGRPIQRALLGLALALAASPSFAEERFWLRPGMTFVEVEPLLRERCKELILTKGPAPSITCKIADVSLLAATTKKGRVYRVGLVAPWSGDDGDYYRTLAKKTGFDGAGEPCRINDKPLTCWRKPNGDTLSTGPYRDARIYMNLWNDGIKSEDE